MAKKKANGLPESPMRGVTCKKVNGAIYWYAFVDGKQKSMGSGDEGKELAIAAKSKEVTQKFETKELKHGLEVQRSVFESFNELCNWYIELPQVQKLKSFSRKSQAVAKLQNYFGKSLLARITPDALDDYRDERKKKGVTARTVDLEFETLRAMYNLALKRKKVLLQFVPAEYGFEREDNPRRPVTEEEYEKLLEEADPNFRDVLICGYESAMRSGEIANLRAKDVVFDERRILAQRGGGRKQIVANYIDLGIFDTKTKARRTVPVSEALRGVLERRLEGLKPNAHVFTTANGKPYLTSNISARMKNLCKRAEVPYGDKLVNEKGEKIGVVFHSLRHTRTTIWLEMGYSEEIIRRATGHKSLEAFRRYVKPDPGMVMYLVQGEDELVTDEENGLAEVKLDKN